MSRHLVVCGVGSGMERSLELVKDLGVEITAVTDQPNETVRRLADRTVHAYPRRIEPVWEGLRTAGVGSADGVLSLGYENPPVIAALAARFGVSGLDMETALNCTRKDRRLAVLRGSGVRVPAHHVAADAEDALAGIDRIGVPAVVKPADGTSSMGVTKVAERSGAARAVAHALQASVCGRVVVEEFLSGTEHTVEGVSSGGSIRFTGFSDRNYAAKERFPPYFYENGDTLPSVLAAGDQQRIRDTTAAAVKALGLGTAVFHADILFTDAGEVVVLEVAGRMAGSRFGTEIVPLSTGVNLLPNAVRMALDEPLVEREFTPVRSDAVVLRYLPGTGGRVTAIGDLAAVGRDERVYDLFWEADLRVGTRLPVYRSGKDMLAGVIVRAETIEAAQAVADRTLARLPLTVEPD